MSTSYRRSWFRQLFGAMVLGIVLTVMLAHCAYALQLTAPTGLPPIEEPSWPNYIYLPAIGNH